MTATGWRAAPRLAAFAWLSAAAIGLEGCAAAGMMVADAGAGAGVSIGVEHTLNGIVYKTFTAPANNVRLAALKSLDRMGMPMAGDEKTETGWKLSATANDRAIEIELEKVTSQVTRMRVVANQGAIFFKDSATATEIVLQTAQTLQDDAAAAARATPEPTRRKRAS